MTMWIWIGFITLVLGMLALDLGVFHRKDEVMSSKQALGWTAVWVGMALAFNVGIYFMYENAWLGIGLDEAGQRVLSGKEASFMFFTGYVIEKSLSLDNIFVIALIFTSFGIPTVYQHRVLFWGILGALLMRAGMILAGAALIQRFSWTVYLFGGILILTAVRMLLSEEEDLDPEDNRIVKICRRLFPVTDQVHGNSFFIVENGQRLATPLFLVLVIVECSDVLFAIDSIPAIFSVTTDPFLVFTSNIFAILGLRSLYFALASMLHRFHYLKESLVFLLAFVGVKMLLQHHYHIPTEISLAFIVGILAVGVLASLVGKHATATTPPSHSETPEPAPPEP